MRIIILDEDYTSINRVYNLLYRYSLKRELEDVEFVLTTRKLTSVKQFLSSREAEIIYINAHENMEEKKQLIQFIQASQIDCKIVLYNCNPIEDALEPYKNLIVDQTIQYEHTYHFEKEICSQIKYAYNK